MKVGEESLTLDVESDFCRAPTREGESTVEWTGEGIKVCFAQVCLFGTKPFLVELKGHVSSITFASCCHPLYWYKWECMESLHHVPSLSGIRLSDVPRKDRTLPLSAHQ